MGSVKLVLQRLITVETFDILLSLIVSATVMGSRQYKAHIVYATAPLPTQVVSHL